MRIMEKHAVIHSKKASPGSGVHYVKKLYAEVKCCMSWKKEESRNLWLIVGNDIHKSLAFISVLTSYFITVK